MKHCKCDGSQEMDTQMGKQIDEQSAGLVNNG